MVLLLEYLLLECKKSGLKYSFSEGVPRGEGVARGERHLYKYVVNISITAIKYSTVFILNSDVEKKPTLMREWGKDTWQDHCDRDSQASVLHRKD